jgi:type I restriction enzyme S subunit
MLDSGTPLLRVGNLFTSKQWYYSDLQLEEDKYIQRGDLIYAWSASFGPFIWMGEKVIYHYHIWKINRFLPALLSKKYLYHFLEESTERIKKSGNGIAMIHMTKERMEKLIIPFPPLEEQKRIVEKIDRLMEQCDRLEQLRTEREQKRLTAHAAVNHRLLNAKDDRELQAAWGFIRDRFGELYAVKENVSELRKAILQLAVMGKLVPQDPRDRPASELLKEIQTEKQRLIKEGKIKKKKTLKTTNLSHIQILPENWEMARFSDILIDLKYGTSRKCDYIQNGFPVLRIPNLNVDSGKIDVTDLKYTQLTCQEIKDLSLTSGDLLVVRSNGSASLVGRPAIIDDNSQGFAYAGYLIRLRFSPQCIYSRYLYFALNTIFVRKQIEDPIRTTSGVKNINSKEINCLIIPLPPFPEQKRIVAKIDHLMHLCDQLETNITQQTTRQTQLLNAILANLNP